MCIYICIYIYIYIHMFTCICSGLLDPHPSPSARGLRRPPGLAGRDGPLKSTQWNVDPRPQWTINTGSPANATTAAAAAAAATISTTNVITSNCKEQSSTGTSTRACHVQYCEERPSAWKEVVAFLGQGLSTPNPPTNIVDFVGFDSSTILIQRGVLMSIGDFPESLSQAMLVGTMLVGGLGVCTFWEGPITPRWVGP